MDNIKNLSDPNVKICPRCGEPMSVDAEPGFGAIYWCKGNNKGKMGCGRAFPCDDSGEDNG